MKKIFFSGLLVFLGVLIAPVFLKPILAACNFYASMTTTNKNVSNWATTCTITGNEGIDDPNNSDGSTTSAATLSLTTGGNITINNGGVLRASSITIGAGSISIQAGGKIEPGTTWPLYVTDADGDGWASSFTLYTATASGRRRLGLMKSFSTVDCNDSVNSPANSCAHRRAITLTYSGSTLTNHDVVWTVDTASSISSGYMTSDCGDIRVKDSDATTQLTYWIESGCNTTTTQIWATVPSIPNGGKTIYMDYDGTTAADGFQAWTGTFTLLYNAACPAGWTQNSIFDNAFPQGAATSGGTGGASSHSHAQVSCTTGGPSAAGWGRSSGGRQCPDSSHTHTGATVDISTASNVLPPYLDVVMCKKADLIIPASFIAFFDTTVSTGWTRFSTLDNTFPRGAATYGGTGGATTHSHSTTGGYTTSTASNPVCSNPSSNSSNAASHTHTSSNGTTDTGNNTPPYLDMVFGQANAQTVASAGLITITDVIPPLGWTRFTALDSKFPRGAATYGGTGGSTTHTHSVTVSTGTQSSSLVSTATTKAYSDTHTHSCSATSDSQSNTPPYTNAIYIQRKTPSATTSVGSETQI